MTKEMTKEPKTVKELRIENRYTMQQVSDGSGIPFGTYVAYDCGYRNISFANAKKLAEFYEISADEIKVD